MRVEGCDEQVSLEHFNLTPHQISALARLYKSDAFNAGDFFYTDIQILERLGLQLDLPKTYLFSPSYESLRILVNMDYHNIPKDWCGFATYNNNMYKHNDNKVIEWHKRNSITIPIIITINPQYILRFSRGLLPSFYFAS